MSSFADQIVAAKIAHDSVSAIETVVRQQISDAFTDWDKGLLDAQTIRHKLEATVRSAYRSASAVAAAATARQSELPGWKPSDSVFLTNYLQELLKDVRKNLREFKKSDRGDAARRRAILRIQHSAGVGAQRGYTDALIASYTELEDFGYRLRKVWLANFINNVPCELCRDLHGTEVGLHDDFPSDSKAKSKVYLNLQGPPRHPRCRCHLVILVVTLENAFDTLDVDNPTPSPTTIDTDGIQEMSGSLFTAIIAALTAIIRFFGG